VISHKEELRTERTGSEQAMGGSGGLSMLLACFLLASCITYPHRHTSHRSNEEVLMANSARSALAAQSAQERKGARQGAGWSGR
jgi:hypothetical protein